MDRIDVCVDVARPSSDRIIKGELGMSSREMGEAVCQGREFASWRVVRTTQDEMRSEVERANLTAEARGFLEGLARRQALGGRAIVRLVRVARTAADVNGHEQVGVGDLREASTFRVRAGGRG